MQLQLTDKQTDTGLRKRYPLVELIIKLTGQFCLVLHGSHVYGSVRRFCPCYGYEKHVR